LLLITVPVSAALVTVALFGYALIADGLGTRVRMRTFTEIDQHTGEAVCWARRTYYAGLAPRDGLSFPHDVQVIPLPPPAYRSRNERRGGRAVDWGNQQHLIDGWLESRRSTQFMTVRARHTESRLIVTTTDGQVQVENKLGTPIRHLLVVDDSGAIFCGERLDEQRGPQRLTPIELAAARDKFEKIFAAQVPRHPDYVQYDNSLLAYSRMYGYGQGRGNFYNPQLNTSRLEWAMTQYGPGPKWTPQPGTYLAVVDLSPEIELGVASAGQEASFHVVLGRF
jgi:hypothetical protein